MFAQLNKYSAVGKGLVSFCHEGTSGVLIDVAANEGIGLSLLGPLQDWAVVYSCGAFFGSEMDSIAFPLVPNCRGKAGRALLHAKGTSVYKKDHLLEQVVLEHAVGF